MNYEKQTWVDGTTPLDAEHLNHMEEGINGAYTGDAHDQTARNDLKNVSSQMMELMVSVDGTLTTAGAAADAKLVGDIFDVSPIEGKNLAIGRYTSREKNGVTFTVNEDNTINLSGMATKDTFMLLSSEALAMRFPISAGSYVLSGSAAERVRCYVQLFETETSTTKIAEYYDYGYAGGCKFTVENDCYAVVPIWVSPNINVDGMVLKPQIEKGTKKTDFVSPFACGFKSKRFEAVEKNIEELQERNFEVPQYYFEDDYLPNKINRINELARSCGSNGDAFVFICDTHWEYNAKKSPNLLRYIREHTRIDRLFGGGDYQSSATKEPTPLYEATKQLRDAWDGPRYLTLGNHDYMGSEAYALTDNDLYYLVNSYGMERVGNLSRNYYYVDNQQMKLRYIVLNRYIDRVPVTSEIHGINEEQRTWLQNVALDVEDGWGVLVFVHDLYRFIADQGDDTTRVSLGYSDSAATVSILDDFKESGGTVVGVFCGEAHLDMVNRTGSGIPVITTTCDKNQAGSENAAPRSYQWAERLNGTIYEQAFDVMVIDKTNRTIHAVRIGYPARDNLEGSWGELVEERTITY